MSAIRAGYGKPGNCYSVLGLAVLRDSLIRGTAHLPGCKQAEVRRKGLNGKDLGWFALPNNKLP